MKSNQFKTSIFSILLGLPFVIAYFVIRSLPVSPCDFLHEETFNSEGILDYCGPGDSAFVDLSIRKWPMQMSFKALDPVQVGLSCRFEINIKQADGSPLGPNDIALSHSRKIHLLAIDETLRDYQHIHPHADRLFDGTWRFNFTPRKPGLHKVFLDFIPLRSPRRVLLSTSFFVEGEQKEFPVLEENLSVEIGTHRFELRKDSKTNVGIETLLEFTGQNKQGELVSLSPVMGAFAHMVAFDPELKGFAHLHPTETFLPSSENDTHSGSLSFSFMPPKAGTYRLWAQIKLENDPKETFIPFDLKVGS